MPLPLWYAIAFAARILPEPPLTRDQLVLISRDNVVAASARGFEALGIAPRGVLEALGS